MDSAVKQALETAPGSDSQLQHARAVRSGRWEVTPAPIDRLAWMRRGLEAIALLIVAIFTIYLFAQHRMVFPYHDDWGIAVLDYVGEQKGFVGQDFSPTHVVHFLSGMYQRWSGRMLAFVFQIYLFKYGIEYVRLVQIGIILSTMYFAMKLSSEKKFLQPLVLVPIACFLGLPAFSVAGGLYWFSASISYVWGIPFLLFAIWLIRKQGRLTFASAGLLACAASFHEEMAVAVIALVATHVVLGQLSGFNLKLLLKNAAWALPIGLACGITILAPGNFNRKSVSHYTASTWQGILMSNAAGLVERLGTNGEGHVVAVLFLLSLALLMILMVGYSRNKIRSCVSASCVTALLAASYFWAFPAFVGLALVAFGTILFFLRTKIALCCSALLSYAAAIGSLAVLLFAPGVAGRSLLPFYFLMLVPVTFSFLQLGRTRLGALPYLAILAVLPYSMRNARDIYVGYESNYQANVVNDGKLVAARYEMQHGASTQRSVLLYKLPEGRYGETMPYQRPLIEKWMKKYYSLPQDVTFVWQ